MQHGRLFLVFLLIALPLALFVWLQERNSWRPRPLPGVYGVAHALAFSPDGRFLVAEGDQSQGSVSSSTFCFWNMKTGALLQTHKGQDVSSANSLFFSPDGQTLFASIWAVEEGDVVFWQAKNGDWSKAGASRSWLPVSDFKSRMDAIAQGKETEAVLGYKVSAAALSPAGNILAVASLESATSVGLWDAKTHRLIHRLPPKMTDSFCVAFSPDGKTLAVGTSSRFKGDTDGNGNSYVVLLWDWRTKKHLRSLRGHAGAIHSIAFSPDGEYIASGSDDGTAKLWDTETGICVRTITKSSPQIQVAFSPDGKTLACTGNPLTLIDLSTGRIKRTFPTSNIVAFSSDSSTLASQVNGQIKLWRLK